MKRKLTREMFQRAAGECEQLNAGLSYREREARALSCCSPYSCDVISYVAAQDLGIERGGAYSKTRPIRDIYSQWMSPGPDPSWTFWLEHGDANPIDPKVLRPMLLLFAGEVLDGVEVDIDEEDKE